MCAYAREYFAVVMLVMIPVLIALTRMVMRHDEQSRGLLEEGLRMRMEREARSRRAAGG